MAFTDQQIQTLKLLLETQSEGYKDAINRLHADIKETKKEHEEMVNELRKSLEFTQRENDDMKKEIMQIKIENVKLNTMVDLNKNNILQIQGKEKEIEDRTDQIDDRSRKMNLVLSGIPEGRGENNEQCFEKTRKVINEKLEIPNPDLVTVFRIGKPENGKTRDILVKFNNIDQRNTILKKKKTLKGQQLFIKEDYCKNTIQIRNALLPKLQEARRQGKFAYLNYRDLIIKSSSKFDKNNGDKMRVQQAVNVIEQSLEGAIATSPLPSPFRTSSQSTDSYTPPKRTNEKNILEISKENGTQLRPRGQIKYPK